MFNFFQKIGLFCPKVNNILPKHCFFITLFPMKKNKYLHFLILVLFCGLLSCDMFDYHPYDVKIDNPRDINSTNIPIIERLCAGKDTVRFVAMGDSQGFYNETRSFVSTINRRNDIDFVIHGGDFTDYGTTEEFLWQRDIMKKLKVPYVGIIGNHDCLGTGKDAFKTIWGDSNFSFIAGNTKFVCLNTNALEYDYSEAIPDFNFIINEINDTTHQVKNTVVCMHARPYSDVFNNNVAQVFIHYIKQFPNLLFCYNAHGHSIDVADIYGDGTLFYQSDCMEGKSYLIFTITPQGYDYEVCYY